MQSCSRGIVLNCVCTYARVRSYRCLWISKLCEKSLAQKILDHDDTTHLFHTQYKAQSICTWYHIHTTDSITSINDTRYLLRLYQMFIKGTKYLQRLPHVYIWNNTCRYNVPDTCLGYGVSRQSKGSSVVKCLSRNYDILCSNSSIKWSLSLSLYIYIYINIYIYIYM